MMFSAKLTKSEAGNWWDEDSSMIIDDLASYLLELPVGTTMIVECEDLFDEPKVEEPAKKEQKIGAKQPGCPVCGSALKNGRCPLCRSKTRT